MYSKETSVEIVVPQRPLPGPEILLPPFTDQMCFVTQDMGRNSMNQDILMNIQVVQCKPGEICEQQRESQYYGMGLGYVCFLSPYLRYYNPALGLVCLFLKLV